jgi:hypothetical protein
MILHKTLSHSDRHFSTPHRPVIFVTFGFFASIVLLMSTPTHYSTIVYAQQSLPPQGNLIPPLNNSTTIRSNNPLMGLGFLKSSGMFNGSSFIATVGISTVNGIKVTGINLPENNRVAVMLAASNSTTPNMARSFPSVTAIAVRIALSHDDLTSLMSAAAESSTKTGGGFMSPLVGQKQGTNNTADYSLSQFRQNNTSTFNSLSFLKNMQIGSSSLVNADWKVPHIMRMGLFGNKTIITPVADLVLVEVVPYTGESGATQLSTP